MLLKQVEKVQPDHEFMNITLGRLALVSGQFDKAVVRLEKLIKLYPTNLEAYYYLSEAYRALGKKDQAISCLQDAKKYFLKVPEAQEQIDKLIQNIKQS
jgi:predicted Zn-dependent protease